MLLTHHQSLKDKNEFSCGFTHEKYFSVGFDVVDNRIWFQRWRPFENLWVDVCENGNNKKMLEMQTKREKRKLRSAEMRGEMNIQERTNNQHPNQLMMIWFFARLNANFPFIVSSSLWGGGRLGLKNAPSPLGVHKAFSFSFQHFNYLS